MEFTCKRGELFEIIGSVQAVIPGRSTHPVLSNTLLKVEKERVFVFGTDLDISLDGELEAKVKAEGAIAVPANDNNSLDSVWRN